MKSLIWCGSTRRDLAAFPQGVRHAAGFQLELLQRGLDPDDWKPMKTIGVGVREIRIREQHGAWRVIYLCNRPEGIYVLHAFQKKSARTSPKDIELATRRFQAIGKGS